MYNVDSARHYSTRPKLLVGLIARAREKGATYAKDLAKGELMDEKRAELLGESPAPHLPGADEIEKLNRTIFKALHKIARTVFESSKLKVGKYTLAKLASPKMAQAWILIDACAAFTPDGLDFDGVTVDVVNGTAIRINTETFKCCFRKIEIFSILQKFASAHGYKVGNFVKEATAECEGERLKGAEYSCIVELPNFTKVKKYCKNGISVDVDGRCAANLDCELGPFFTPCDAKENGANPTTGAPCVEFDNLGETSIFTVKKGERSDDVLHVVSRGAFNKMRIFKTPVFEFTKNEIKLMRDACKEGLKECKFKYSTIVCNDGILRVNIPVELDRKTLKPCLYKSLEFAHDGCFYAEITNITLAKFTDWDGRILLDESGKCMVLPCQFGAINSGTINGGTAPTGELVTVSDYLHELASAKPGKRPARRRKEAPAGTAEPATESQAPATDVHTTAPAAETCTDGTAPTGGTSDLPATTASAPTGTAGARNSDDEKAAPYPAKRANVFQAEQFEKAYEQMKFISAIIRACVMICAYFIAGETARTQIRLATLLNLSGRTSTHPKEEKPAKATETAKADDQTTDGVPAGGLRDGPAREPTDTDEQTGAGAFAPTPAAAPKAAPQPNDLPAPAIAPPARGGHLRRTRPNNLRRRTIWAQVRRRAPTTKAPERFARPNNLRNTKIVAAHLPRGSPKDRLFA